VDKALATIELLLGVCFQVLGEHHLLAEGLGAVSAGEWSLPRMDALVSRQVCPLPVHRWDENAVMDLAKISLSIFVVMSRKICENYRKSFPQVTEVRRKN